METATNGVWIRRLTCKSGGAVRTGISQGLAQTAAIMQPSKSYYHCNGTEAWEERRWVCGRGREMRWKGAPSFCLPPLVSRKMCAHTRLFLYLIATVTESSEVTPVCQINVSLEKKKCQEKQWFLIWRSALTESIFQDSDMSKSAKSQKQTRNVWDEKEYGSNTSETM